MVFRFKKLAQARLSPKKRSKQERQKNLKLELLEERRLLAVGPQLLGIDHANGVLIQDGSTHQTAPGSLTFRFEEGQVLDANTLAGIRLTRSGSDYVFDNGNDIVVQPGFVGLGQNASEVIMRFSQTLPDDAYRVTIFGVGSGALRNVEGFAFNDLTDDEVDNGGNLDLHFNLALGAQIISVVPQPIVRDPLTGALTQSSNQIEVYFNNDALNVASVTNPAYYRLINTHDQSLLFPQSVEFDATRQMATLNFAENLSLGTFHLQIGVSEEFNGSIDAATNLGTVAQRAIAATYSSPVQLDSDGNPIVQAIPDGSGSVISIISVQDPIFIADLNVEVDIEHTWAPDLRIFLQGPGGQRVELMRDLGTEVLGGQIYGIKFDDLNGNGLHDAGEPGLPGWTMFIDANGNGKLDAGERSTVTDAEGRYSFVGLELDRTYSIAAVPQPRWTNTVPSAGGLERLFGADFSAGAVQNVRFAGDPQSGNFRLGIDGRTTEPIVFAGVAAVETNAANIQAAVAEIIDPGIAVRVVNIAPSPEQDSEFLVIFTLNGPGTPVDHPLLAVVTNELNQGTVAVATTADAEGFTSFGPNNLWNLSTNRGSDPGHSGLDSFYFGTGGGPNGGGSYVNNANGTLISPVIDLTDPTLTGEVNLRFNHRLRTEAGFDFATVNAVVNGVRTELLRTSDSTTGFQAVQLSLTQFVGQQVQIEFNFSSDGSVIDEGWFVDDIQISAVRGMQQITLTTSPQEGVIKNVNFGSTRGPLVGPDSFGYEAFVVATDFQDVTTTGTRVFEEFDGEAFVKRIGSTGTDQATAITRDALGNFYVTGSFQGTVNFGPGPGATTLTSAGNSDIFIAKYADNGDVIWAHRVGGGQVDSATAIAVDAAGNVHVTGSFLGTADFDPGAGTASLVSSGNSDAYILKLDTDGNFIWVRQIGGTGADGATGIAIDAAGNVITVGFFSGTADMNPGGGVFNLTSAGGTDIFVSKLNSAGEFVWARRAGANGADRAAGVVVDTAGDIVITGSFSGTVDFDPGAAQQNRTSAGGTDAFIWKLTSNGNFAWVDTFGGASNDRGSALAISATDDIYFTGSVNSSIQVRRLTSTGGTVWTQNYSSSGTNAGEAIAVGPDQKVVVTGSMRGTINFGGDNIVSAGGTDIFVLGLRDDGSFEYARRSGGTQDDVALGLTIDDIGNAILVGAFRGTATFDLAASVETVVSDGSSDAFIAKSLVVQRVDDETTHLTPADLQGFQFPFYGNVYDELFFSTNGLISFGSPNDSGANTDLTAPPAQASIAAFWDDLVVGSSNLNAVYWEVLGTGANQRLVLQWNEVELKGLGDALAGPVNFQAVLNADGTIQFNYQNILGPLTLPDGAETPVGSFLKGSQTASHVASDALGNHVVVWESPGQDGGGLGVYARRFDAGGNPLGAEILVNVTTAGTQSLPRIAVNASGRFVVVWQGNGAGDSQGVFARVFDSNGSALTGEILVNALVAGLQTRPDVQISDSGEFIVVWDGAGEESDAEGVFARRFSDMGTPLGVVDEVQHIQVLGPPANFSQFTLIHDGQETGAISFAGAGRAILTASNIQTALRALTNTGDTLTVAPLAINEVQTINFAAHVTGGTFTFIFDGQETAPITFAGLDEGATTAANIQAALRALPLVGNALTVESLTGLQFQVTFRGLTGNRDVALLMLGADDLTPVQAPPVPGLAVEETIKGVASNDADTFVVTFLGVDGARNQPQLLHGNRAAGVFHLAMSTVVEGFSGEFRVNNFTPNAQLQPRISRDANGELVVSWTSTGQDGSLDGVFAKRYDANAQALPGDIDELQTLRLVDGSAAGSQFRLRLGQPQTGFITFAGANRGATTAQNIQTGLQAVAPGAVVTALTGNSTTIQRLTFTGTPTGGTFRVAHAGLETADITFAGAANAAQTVTNIQDALNALANLVGTPVTVTALGNPPTGFIFDVAFAGSPGVAHPLMLLSNDSLVPGAAGLNIAMFDVGGLSGTDFLVTFAGAAGRQDQPLLTLSASNGGFLGLTAEETRAGSNSEFQVNQETINSQSAPALAKRGDGSFVVTWQSQLQDGDGLGIFAQIFDADGNSLSGEFGVNTFTENAQQLPAIATAIDGSFAIAWQSNLQDGFGQGVFVRLFSEDGTPLGDEFNVPNLVMGNQTQPAIESLANGQYVITWTTNAGTGGIHSRLIDSNGQLVSDELEVSLHGLRNQATPGIAQNSNGDYVVVWTDNQRDEFISASIYAQVFDAAGVARTGELLINELQPRTQTLPQVAIDDAGNFVVTWETDVEVLVNGTVTVNRDVRARVFDIAGQPVTSEILVNTVTEGFQITADVAMNPATGDFVVVWRDDVGSQALGQRFDAQGNAVGGEFRISSQTNIEDFGDFAPAIAMNASGQFVVTWSEQPGVGGEVRVLVRIFDAEGTPLIENLNAAETLAGFNFPVDVAITADGTFGVTWINGNENDAFIRIFDSAGAPLSSQNMVNEVPSSVGSNPLKLSVDTNGEFTVVWQSTLSGTSILAQRFTPQGLPIGANVQINSSTAGTRTQPVVAGTQPGEFIVGWLNNSTGASFLNGLFVQRMKTDASSVGIKAAGSQTIGGDLLQIWVDGSRSELVGSGISTRIAPKIIVPERVFAVDTDQNLILELDAVTGAVIGSLPAPTAAGADAGLAFAGQTLYFLGTGDATIYVVNPDNGAIMNSIALPNVAGTSGLAYLNGQLVVQDNASGDLLFVDAFTHALVRQVAPAVAIAGGLVGTGNRGSLFAVDGQSQLIEIDPLDGSILRTLPSPDVDLTGLAFVDGSLLVATASGLVRRLHPDTGVVEDSFQVPASLAALGGDGGGGVREVLQTVYSLQNSLTLDDEAAISIAAAEAPFTGRFRPTEALTAFDQTIANGAWRLEVQDTRSGDTGVLQGWKLLINERQDTPPDAQHSGYIGDNTSAGALAVNDVDMYRFDVLEPGTITVQMLPTGILDGAIRLFNAAGVALAMSDTGSVGQPEQLEFVTDVAGRFYVGVSSQGNTTYSSLNGSGAIGGTSTGSYELHIDFSEPFDQSDDNSSFTTATQVGVLGVGGQVIRAEIRSNPLELTMPGGLDEPGHRHIPAESHFLGGGANQHFTPNRMVMAFEPGVTAEQRAQLLEARGLQVVKTFRAVDVLVVETAPGADLALHLRELNASPSVRYAELDVIGEWERSPNDPRFPEMWGLNNTGQTGGTPGADISALQAWDVTYGSSDVVIAILDSGTDYLHPDLAANMWVNPGEIPGNGIDDDGNGYIDDVHGIDADAGTGDPMDFNGHGTHVAGTVAAAGNNDLGVTGVSWNSKIMSVKLGTAAPSLAAALTALDYITMMKTEYGVNIVVSNNSYSVGGFSQAMFDLIGASNQAGILFVAAAGNSGLNVDQSPNYPAAYDLPGVITVAATDHNDAMANFSNFGATSVDIAAPGVGILSTQPGGGYQLLSGTSMAAPHVAGVVALLASHAPSLSPLEIKQAILAGADVLPNLIGTSTTGGRLNAAQALALAGQGSTGPLGRSTVTAFYNFQDFYGALPSGDVPSNAITEVQKQRSREIFEIFGHHLGIQFIETASSGLTVVTGDMRAIDPTIIVGPGGVAGLSEGSLNGRVIMDAAEDWGNSEYGGGWFVTAMHEIAHSMGLGHSYDLPNLTVMGGFGTGEPIFPGDHDLVHGRYLYPNDSTDLDLFEFRVTESGWFTAETVAERLQPNASLLDTTLSLYRETMFDGAVTRQLIARNDDYFSNDSYLRLRLQPGVYYIGVTSTGLVDVDPIVSNTGFGGTTEGNFELHLGFEPDPAGSIRDLQGVALDGNADGNPGGRFNFWFESGPTIFVDKANDTTPGVDGLGSLESPFDNIHSAIELARTSLIMPRAGGSGITDGESFVVSDGLQTPVTFEFNSSGNVRPGAVAIAFTAEDSRETLANSIVAAVLAQQTITPARLTVAATSEGGIVRLSGAASVDASGSPALLNAPSLIRIVGNGGTDNEMSSLADNLPYLIGIDTNGQTLPDGASVEVPQGVTLMIDGGTLFKLSAANLDAGSSSQVTDRRHGAIQVLGTPENLVSFYSYRDDSVGGDSDGPSTGARGGDWGGLVFRADSDMEESGVFLNWVNHADLVQGGGKLLVGSVEELFTPVHLVGARPTVSFSTIRGSADAAISADPLSFEDSLGRPGPKLHGNLIVENSINGLFVRIRTELGQTIDTFDRPSRWINDEIVHVVTENLLISATPGGPEIDPATGVVKARIDGRLAIDPGVVVKLGGARIETLLGAQLIAEGTLAKPVIFTTITDDSFGGSGSFDTTNDRNSTSTAPGQWGGLFFGATAKGSLDHATVMFAGGLTPIEGNFDHFNAIEVHQADVRIANSLLMHNAAGVASSSRNGRGTNASATIFVRGAQPIIVDNIIRDNAGTAININANSLQAVRRPDYGRTTGALNAYREYSDNYGPLIRSNRLQNNGINGMEVRGAVLTTESVWDDTDIVHVLQSEISILNHHTFSGLRLQSGENESLVIKLAGPNAGFTANGTLLDIDDRIGGSLYVVAAPGRPVIFTSLSDDTATAGFTVNGQPLGDTNNDGPSQGAPGQWRSLRLDRYSNDRNVALTMELEPAFSGLVDVNAVPANAQFLGILAPDEKSGDTNRRLGFQVHGNISFDRPSDVDVYSFTGVAGTEVWLDIDRSGASLDSILELINENGGLLARAVGNRPEDLSGLAMPLTKDTFLGGDFYTTNPRDAGMRLTLPGTPGETSTYFVRVRSKPSDDQLDLLTAGLTRGEYQLQIRLRQVDEKPGSIIRGADIRYATTGIEVIGLPKHSPLIAESVESAAGNDSLGAAQALGNLLTTDRNTLSVGGTLSSATDVDWYSFRLDYDLIQAIGGASATGYTWSTIFDIDYADGIARPDTVLSVFDAAGNLILVSRDSNIEDDQPRAGAGLDSADLTRGSFGTLDPFIGSVQMPAGSVPLGSTTTYYVAVSSNSQLPQALNATFAANSGNSLVRLEPVSSVRRIAEDHIGFSGYASGDANVGLVPVNPTTSLFNISSAASLTANVIPFTLSDVVMYVGRPGQNGLRTVNPATGQALTNVADTPANNTLTSDLVMRSDGRMFMVQGIVGPGNAGENTAGRLVEVDPNTGAQTVIGNDGIPDFDPATDPPNPQQLTSNNIGALAFLRTGFDGGANTPTYNLYYAVAGIRAGLNTVANGSTLYRANPANGSAAVVDGEPWGVRGGIFQTVPGDVGRTTGMAFLNGELFGVSDTGFFYRIDLGTGRAVNITQISTSFSGLALGPQNVENSRYANILFAISTDGTLRALNTGGTLQPIFTGGATSVATGQFATGLAFSPLDFNLWHPTLQRRGDAGHGINPAFDLSRNPASVGRLINGRQVNEAEGGASFYFGFENWVDDPSQADAYFPYGPNAQLGIQATNFHRDLASNPGIGNNYNLPGGALGSLATNAFSLGGTVAADKPTLYFNYFLETEARNSVTGQAMRDSARVLVSSNGGSSWQLLATNNSILSTAGTAAELPRFISPSVNASSHPRQRVQELFDNTGGWRQARVDLSEFAGLSNLLIRFDFSTAGSMNQGVFGDSFGNFFNRERALNNSFEGFYVDDILIGYAERGEMVTGGGAATQYFTIPQNPNAADPAQVLVGNYQLEIRRGTEYGATISDDGVTAIFQTFDTNARMIPEFRRLGDRNLARDQGQVLIEANSISFVSQSGILVDAGPRDVNGNLPHPGSVIRTPTLNTQRLVPGVHLENNVVANFGQAGIVFSGDGATTGPQAAVPFGRLINNTIYGGATATGTGILVRNNASPTILNNILSNAAIGLSVDATSISTVIGANLFKGNAANGSIGENAILLQASDPLFVNPNAGNYYLALGSLAIDSSINSLADRPNFTAVKAPLGIPASPILAPDRDRYNQLRLDDPSQDPPPGLGSNIFKDRGAIERADFVGPFARLVNPVDNDALGIDLNPDVNHVLLNQPILSRIVIQLVDPGIGIDDTTVTASTVSVTLDGVALVSGVDYDFNFNVTNKLIILTSLANNGPVSSTYVVTLDNSAATGIKDQATNALTRNEPSGLTRFTIETDVIDIVENLPDFQIPLTELTVLEDNEAELGIDQTVIPDFATDIVIPGSDGANVIFFTTLSYSNPGLFEEPPTIDPSGTLIFKTAQDRNGSSVVIVQLADAGLGGTASPIFSVPKTFTINLTPVNDAPEYTISSVANVNEDQGLVSLVGYASQILPGPVTAEDEIDQNVSFVVAAVDPSSFTVQPTISPTGTLQFQTAADLNSDIANFDITVYLIDDGSDIPTNINRSETQTLSIIVNPINDSPTFTLALPNVQVIEDVESFENIDRVLVPGVVTNAAPGPITAIDEVGQVLNFQVVSVSAPQLFEVQPALTADGSLTFKTAANQNGTAFVVIQLFDDGASEPLPNNNASLPQTLTITITPINDAPEFLLTGDSTTDEDAGFVSIPGFATNILRGPANALDESGQSVNFIVTALDPSSFHILPAISPTGTLTFQTAANVNSLNADLRVAVALRDSGPASPPPNVNQSETVTTTLNIVPVNDPPILTGFTALVTEDTPVTILASAVLENARPGPTIDEDSQSLSITLMELVTSSGGLITPVFTGTSITSFTYAPGRDYVGTDTILYVVTDSGTPNRSATGTITLEISGVNDAPTFVAGPNQSIEEDADAVEINNWASNILQGPLTAVDELANQTVSFEVVTNRPELFEQLPAVSAEGTLTFKAAADANGVAIVSVTAVDSGPGDAPNVNRSVTQSFTIAIAPVNDPPVFTPGPHVTVDEDSGAYAQPWATAIAPAIGMLLTPPRALDEQGQTVSFEVVVSQPNLFAQQPAISPDGQLTFSTAADAHGVSTVIVTAVDSGPTGGSNVNRSLATTLTISLTSVNDAPVAVNDFYSIDENSLLSVASPGLLLNDIDVDLPNDVLRVMDGNIQSVLGARVSLNADGSFSYDPREVAVINALTTGQNITDSFTYRIQDQLGATSELATVTITVTGVDDPPLAVNDNFVVATGRSSILNVLANDDHIDTPIDANSVALSQQPVFGSVVVNSGGTVTYTPGPGFRGTDTFAYTVADVGGNRSNEALVTVNVNSAPVANNDTAFTYKNEPIDINVLANDSDFDGTLDPSTVEIVVAPSTGGTATVLENGQIRFTPATGFAGQVQLSYVVSDNLGTPSNVANVSIRVQNSRWQNPSGALDVSGDGFVSPIDVLLIINYLNSGQPTFLPNSTVIPPPYLDPSGDERVTPLDIILIINYLNTRSAGGEGEGALTAATESATSTTFAMMATPAQMVDTVGAAGAREVQSRRDESFATRLSNTFSGDTSDDSGTAMAPLFTSGMDDDEEDLVEMLSCSADEFTQQSLRSAVDSFFGDIGPKRPK